MQSNVTVMNKSPHLVLRCEAQVGRTVDVGLVSDQHSTSYNEANILSVIKYAADIEKVLRFLSKLHFQFKCLSRNF